MPDKHRHFSHDASAGVRPPDADRPGPGPPDKSQRAVSSSDFFARRRRVNLEEGRAYLVKEKKPEIALAAFHEAVDAGWRPMYITRQHPNHIVRRRGEKEIRVVWLATTLGKDDIDPHNLNSLSNLITNFVTDGPRAVILLDGIEYLMINNDFARILHFLEYVNEQIALNRAALILPVDERALDAKELAYIERNTIVLHDSIFVLFIPRAAEVLEECRAVQVEVGLEGSAVDDSPLPFEDKVRNARRENVPFIVVVEGGEKTLRTLGGIRQDGRQVWMTIERLAEAVRRESETPPKEARVTVPGSSESITLRNLPALCGDHIRKLGEIYRSNLLPPDRARTFKLALSGTDECPACVARRKEEDSKPRRMRAKVLVVGEPDLRGSSLLRGFVVDAFDDRYIQ